MKARPSLACMVIPLALGGIWPASAQNAFVANSGNNTVSIVDVPSGTVIGAVPVGSEPRGVAVAPNGTTAYVTDLLGKSVSVIDAAKFPQAVAATISTTSYPSAVALAPAGGTAYVASGVGTNALLSVINTATDHLIASIALPGTPAGVAVAPNGSHVYVTSGTTTGLVSVIASATKTVVASIPVGGSPDGIAVTPNSTKAFVTQSLSAGSVTVIDLLTNKVTGAIEVGGNPIGIAVTPNGSEAFVANHHDNSVSIINTATDRVVGTVKVGQGPFGVAFSADGSRAYVANRTDNTVSEISVAHRLVVATIAVGSAPEAFGNFVGRTPPASALLSSVLPGAAAAKIGKTATANASILNTGAASLSDCRILLPASAPAGVSMVYATTDADGAVNSGPNPKVSIAGNGSQSFRLQFSASKPALAPAQPLLFVCAGTSYAPIILGVNTIYLQFAATLAAAIDAVAATASGDGIVEVPLSMGQEAAFAVASENVGATGNLTVTADTGAVPLPVTLSLCQTSIDGQCVAAPGSSVAVHFAAGATPTFSVFVSASAAIALNPENSRIFVRFLDQSLASHGLTSVAVETD